MNPTLKCPNCKNTFKLSHAQSVIPLNQTDKLDKVDLIATTCPYCNLALSVRGERLAALFILGGFIACLAISFKINSMLPVGIGMAILALRNPIAALFIRIKGTH